VELRETGWIGYPEAVGRDLPFRLSSPPTGSIPCRPSPRSCCRCWPGRDEVCARGTAACQRGFAAGAGHEAVSHWRYDPQPVQAFWATTSQGRGGLGCLGFYNLGSKKW